jgi:hypothetical protein
LFDIKKEYLYIVGTLRMELEWDIIQDGWIKGKIWDWMCVRVNIDNLVCLKTGKTLLNFQQELAKKQFPSLSNNWECSWYIWYLNLMMLHHVFWRNLLKVSLNLLALSLVTRPTETFNGYLGVTWIASFPLFLEFLGMIHPRIITYFK